MIMQCYAMLVFRLKPKKTPKKYFQKNECKCQVYQANTHGEVLGLEKQHSLQRIS